MAAITSSILGATMGAVAIAKGASGVADAKKKISEADKAIEVATAEEKNLASQDPTQKLSVDTTLADESIKNIRAMGTQGMQTLGDMGARGAFGVGGVMTAGTEQLAGLRGEKGKQLYGLQYAKAVSEQAKNARLQAIAKDDKIGANQMKADAEEAKASAIGDIVGGVGGMLGGVTDSIPLFGGGGAKKMGGLMEGFTSGGADPSKLLSSLGMQESQIADFMGLSGKAQGSYLDANLSQEQKEFLQQMQGMNPEQLQWMFGGGE